MSQLTSRSPIDGSTVVSVTESSPSDVASCIEQSVSAFKVWREVPAPQRGELVRLFAEELRQAKDDLAAMVTLEAGKIVSEGLGEVQEMIDICDFAVGLSRQLYGLTIVSERSEHRMMETWHPMGPCAVISAFNFPVAVWAWNAALALVCGNPVIWKPSEKTPGCADATLKIFDRALARYGRAPAGLVQCVHGGSEVGATLVDSTQIPIVSATGSTRMGALVGPKVAARFGRSILELGGNNAMIVAPSADLDLAVRAIVFSAVGTAGQRCTTLRRLIVHESVREALLHRLLKIYPALRIGDPRDRQTLIGPLIDAEAGERMQRSVTQAIEQGGRVLSGGSRRLVGVPAGGWYPEPALIEMPSQTSVVRAETFAPILYVLGYTEFTDALALQNDVPQGLSSCIFTRDMREAERFLSVSGSDCGIANVNIGPSGAEIGGAFGGEKQTGGGRESGSDAWKGYMRRQTATINYSDALPLAQGVSFELE
jgi:aldehyde dehydrogenase (NAD+)